MKLDYNILGTDIELIDSDDSVTLSERHYFNENKQMVIEYQTEDSKGNVRQFMATKTPENLSPDERYKVLDYCLGLGNYDDNEIVTSLDLFLQFELIKEIK